MSKIQFGSVVSRLSSLTIPLEGLKPLCYLGKMISPSNLLHNKPHCFPNRRLLLPLSKSNNFMLQKSKLRAEMSHCDSVSMTLPNNAKGKIQAKKKAFAFSMVSKVMFLGGFFPFKLGIKITIFISFIKLWLYLEILFIKYFPQVTLFHKVIFFLTKKWEL